MSSEADTRANYIDPALKAAHWQPGNIIREHYFTDGRKLAGGVRGRRCFVDYLLHKDNRYLAVVEAKKESEHPTKGLQQAIDYAKKLLVRFVYSSNGKQTYEFDLETGKGDYIEFYPTPQELENRYTGVNSDPGQQLRNVPFHLESAMQPRYYQELAVHAATDAIGKGKLRVLLTLATETRKTYIAFQIVHKLFQSRWNKESPGTRRPRILFLADRNILADQAINTFNPYEKDIIKINGEEVRKRGGIVPTNAHIFFAIYQAIAERENIEGYYKAYLSDFFDLVMIDECHRGSANETGSWRAILDCSGQIKPDEVVTEEVAQILKCNSLRESDAEFLIAVGKTDEAEEYLLKRADQLDGNHYGSLLSLAQSMESENRPLAASLLYRSLLVSILARGYTRAYPHGIRHLKKLDKLAADIADWKGFNIHEAFKEQIKEAHGRKRSFWSKYEVKK